MNREKTTTTNVLYIIFASDTKVIETTTKTVFVSSFLLCCFPEVGLNRRLRENLVFSFDFRQK